MKVKWLVLLWMFAMLVLVSPIQHAIASTNVSGGIDYTKSQLTPTLEQGAKKNPPNNNGGGGGGGGNENGEEEDDRPWWEKAVDVVVDKVKKGTETVVETVKDAGEYISDKTSEIVDATTEWWNERSLLEKSLIIVGVIATVVTLGAAAGVISAGAALTMGVMGAANYALYAATTDNVSFWGGLMWGGLGMVGGGIGLAAKGAKFLAPARAALSSGKAAIIGRLGALVPAAVKGSRFYPMIASAARTIIPGMMKGAVAGSGLAVYTHMAKWAITGETPNWGDVARDAMIWGASGAVAGGMFKPVTNFASKFVSKGKAMVAGASSSAGSESVVSDWLEGKNIDLKKAAIAASAVVVLGGAGVLATQMTNKSVKQVASTTELATDTAKVATADNGVQAGKNGSNVKPAGPLDLQYFAQLKSKESSPIGNFSLTGVREDSYQESISRQIDANSLRDLNNARLKPLQGEPYTRDERKFLYSVRHQIENIDENTVLQKVIPKSSLDAFIQDTAEYKSVGGFITRLQDVKHLRTANDIKEGLRLDYSNSEFTVSSEKFSNFNEDSVGAIRFPARDIEKIKIPYYLKTIKDEQLPLTGNGFTGSRNWLVPEYQYQQGHYTNIPDGAELYEITNSGEEILRGIFSNRKGKFVPVD
jgi:hypothetical protein